MHIIHLVTRLLRAGSEENTIETCKWQVKTGHKVTLIHGREVDPWWQDNPIPGVDLLGVPQMVHPTDPLADIQALRALRVIYRRLQPDVIHTHQSKAGFLGRLAAHAVPATVVAHTIHIVPFEGVNRSKQTLYIAAEKLAARRTNVFIGVSEAMGHAYTAAGITQPGQVHCVRSGMDLDRFRSPNLPHDWRNLLLLRQGNARPRVALMLAAFEPRKRHVEFLRAFARTAHALPYPKLLLAGTGPEEARVRAVVQDLRLQDHVIFCGHRPDPEALLALADVSVLTSEREGLPRVVVQSIAAGCPVVVNDLPGINEVVQDGVNGHVVARGNLDGVVARMQSMLSNDQTLKRLGAGALGTDVDAWSLSKMGASVTALYNLPAMARAA